MVRVNEAGGMAREGIRVNARKMRAYLRELFGSRVRFDEPLAGYTSLGIGGPADVVVEVFNEDELLSLVGSAREEGIPYFVIGNGTNVLVKEGGFRGIVIRLIGGSFSQCSVAENYLTAGAGTRVSSLIQVSIEHSLSGLEKLAGIPGCVGGAVRMNAGARGCEFGDLVREGRVMTNEGNSRSVPVEEMGFSYRECALLRRAVLLKVVLKLDKGIREEIAKRARLCAKEHAARMPAEQCAGSVFKNPAGGKSAGELIDELGLRGTGRGGAAIWEKHGNVIVNRGDARARDVIALMELARERVHEKYGIELEPEIIIVGEEEKGENSGCKKGKRGNWEKGK